MSNLQKAPKTKIILFKLHSKNIELGIEIKDTLGSLCSFIQPDYNHFTKDMADKYNCSIEKNRVTDDGVTYDVFGLNPDYYTDILFGFKRKLETTFETGRLYFRVI